MPPLTWQNADLARLRASKRLTKATLEQVASALEAHSTLSMRPLQSGLFPAAGSALLATGYTNVWVRDNVYVAYAHYLLGMPQVAARTVRVIFEFFLAHRHRFDDIIAHKADPEDVMCRPHVRFDGATLKESGERWSHAQNDALGYALWLFAKLAAAGTIELDSDMVMVASLLSRYFGAIRYWEDEDSGHWEETRKRSASSIGTVVAGLEALLDLARARYGDLKAASFPPRLVDSAAELAMRGRVALDAILPSECTQASPRQNRRYDAALLWLIHPLGVMTSSCAEIVLSDIARYLTSTCGIRRYLGDSYFAPDYEERLSLEERTRYSDDLGPRDALLDRIGHEAEWCIFDPILSAYYGKRYRDTGSTHDFDWQVLHFDRSLAQVTSDWRCPELYYMKRGVYVPGPHAPLLWTQANVTIALCAMRATLNGAGRAADLADRRHRRDA
jgi:phosphorylase kinase alpha/beta subunit